MLTPGHGLTDIPLAAGGIIGIIGWIIVGIAAGWLAGVVRRTNRSI